MIVVGYHSLEVQALEERRHARLLSFLSNLHWKTHYCIAPPVYESILRVREGQCFRARMDRNKTKVLPHSVAGPLRPFPPPSLRTSAGAF